jgi:uncharacterized alkaline shock family protein YloU
MVNKDQKEIIGSLKISEDVLATIASVAVKEVEGVASVANVGNIKEMWGFKKNSPSKSIKIEFNGDVAIIGVHINLKHGAKIQPVSVEIQQKVKEAVQSMTGITVSKVNVHIVGIEFEPEPSEPLEQNDNV